MVLIDVADVLFVCVHRQDPSISGLAYYIQYVCVLTNIYTTTNELNDDDTN